MKIGIKSFLITIIIGFGLLFNSLGSSYSQTASLILNGVQQYFDNNGNPLTSGKVYYYEVGTTTFKPTWQNSAMTTPNTNPVTLNAAGRAIIYGNGLYRQIVKDQAGNLIWDAVTSPAGGGGGGSTLVGDGNLVGTIHAWAGLIAPNQYVFAYGQEVSRLNFPDFFTAITQLINVNCSSGSNTLTGISDTSQITVNSPVELTCVPTGTTVVSKTSSTIVVSNPANVSLSAVARFFPFGNGNGSTTFNVPDLRGYTIAGRDNMGPLVANRLTAAFFNAPGQGAVGGAQSVILTQANLSVNLGTATSVVTDPGHSHIVPNNFLTASGTPQSILSNTGGATTLNPPTSTNTTGITVATTITNPLGGQAFSKVQPTMELNYIIKITPDVSASSVSGVASLGGMQGIIACGSGLICTGNIINTIGTSAGGANNNVQYNLGSAIAGSNNFNFIGPDTVTIGSVGTTGKFSIFGTTSGNVTQTVQSVAGTPTITWGTSTGTPSVTASAPLAINTTTGNISLTNGSFIVSGISGGIPYYNSTSTITSSALLAANQIMIGGGASNPPTTFSCATSTTVVHGGTSPTCGQIVSGDITANIISNDRLVQSPAVTLKGNPTNALASASDFTISGLTQSLTPNTTNDMLLIWDSVAGVFKKINPTTIASAATAGVSSIAGNTGAFTLTGGITNSGNAIQNTGGVNTNILNAKTADYTILTTDAGKTIYGTGGPFTITLPSVAGFGSTDTVSVCNGDANDNTHHAIRLSGFPNPIFARLYMQQCVQVSIENGAWRAKTVPGRFRPTFAPTIFVDTGGSNTNDGLVSNAAANAVADINTAYTILNTEYDLALNIPTISPTSGQTFTGSVTFQGPMQNTPFLNLIGNGGVATVRATATTGNWAMQLSDFSPYVVATNINFDCTGGNSTTCYVINLHQQVGIDLTTGITLTGNGATNSAGLFCDSKAKINNNNAPTLAGTMQYGFNVNRDCTLVFTAGLSYAPSTTVSVAAIQGSASTIIWDGAYTGNTSVSVTTNIKLFLGARMCLNSFSTSGSLGGGNQQWIVLNNSILANVSANAIPGSAGLSSLGTWANGIIVNSGASAGGC